MSRYSTAIDSIDRQYMSIMPPPPFDEESGCNVAVSPQLITYYGDLRLTKQRGVVRIEEKIEDDGGESGIVRYRLYVVRMGNRHDLNVILAAARHLQLISKPFVEEVYADELSDSYERSRLEASYRVAIDNVCVDGKGFFPIPVILSAEQRKSIWLQLFEAAGYVVEWGSVLNVKKESV